MNSIVLRLQRGLEEALQAINNRFMRTDTEINNLRKRIESLEREPRQSFKQKLREREK